MLSNRNCHLYISQILALKNCLHPQFPLRASLNGKPCKLSTADVTLCCALSMQNTYEPQPDHPPQPLCKIVYPKPPTPVSHVIASASVKGRTRAGRGPLIRLVSSQKQKIISRDYGVCLRCFVQVIGRDDESHR